MSGAKKLIFEQFALVGQALSSGHRLGCWICWCRVNAVWTRWLVRRG